MGVFLTINKLLIYNIINYFFLFRSDDSFEALKQKLATVMPAGGEPNLNEDGTSVSSNTSIQKTAPISSTQDISSTATTSEPPKAHPATISHSVSVEQQPQPISETAKRKDEA